MELFEIATEVECISIKADCFATIAATLGLNADDSRCFSGLADMFELLSNKAREVSEEIYEKARETGK
jgi:hypothetical protein